MHSLTAGISKTINHAEFFYKNVVFCKPKKKTKDWKRNKNLYKLRAG